MNPNTRSNVKTAPIIDRLWPDGRILSRPVDWRDVCALSTADLRSLAEEGGVATREGGRFLDRATLLARVKVARTSESRRLGHVSRKAVAYAEAAGVSFLDALNTLRGELPESIAAKLDAARAARLDADQSDDNAPESPSE